MYSVQRHDLDAGESIVVDLLTHQTTRLPGAAWTAGDWLVWNAGDVYRMELR